MYESMSEEMIEQAKEAQHYAQVRNIVKQEISTMLSKRALSTQRHMLAGKYPLEVVDDKHNKQVSDLLVEHGSPACTDGEKVYVHIDLMARMLAGTYRKYDQQAIDDARNKEGLEGFWRVMPTEQEYKLDGCEVRKNLRGIINHEYTHALFEHSKIGMQAKNKSAKYQAVLQAAQEIQANDGMIENLVTPLHATQQLHGVINKRTYPNAIGKHTLKEIMDAIWDDVPTPKQTSLNEKVARATGAEGRMKEKIEGTSVSKGGSDEELKKTSDQMLEQASAEFTADQLKALNNVILSALSNKLKYDPDMDKVMFANTIRHKRISTYSRPSRRSMLGSGPQLLKKGIKRVKIEEVNTANNLVVIAIDKSGSMSGVADKVNSMLNKLLDQAAQVAREARIEVGWDNLVGVLHDDFCTDPQKINSDAWETTMRRYTACGGNDFSKVYRKVRDYARDKDYKTVSIIDFGDGLDAVYVEEREKDERIQWLDAVVTCENPRYLKECVGESKIERRVIMAA